MSRVQFLQSMFKLDYKLDDHGWADARIQLGKYVAEATVSYVEDTLGDLASENCSCSIPRRRRR